MPLPPKLFYPICETANRWSVSPLDIVGWATFVQDPDTWATLAFSLHGKYTDICAAISGHTGRP